VIGLETPMVVASSKKMKSWVCEHFKKMATKGECVCTICNQIVWGVLLEEEYGSKQSQKRSHELTTHPITSWLQDCPNFHKCMVNFMVATYQAYCICEEPTFRELCMSLNKKSPHLSRAKLATLVKEEYQLTILKLKKILSGRDYAVTSDAWTSFAQNSYVTCTGHFIDRKTWTLHSIVLGLFDKKGTPKAADVIQYLETQLTYFDLSYQDCVAAVTDTESTMVAAGHLIKQHSAQNGGKTE